jgi:hypothetical protein
VPEAKLQDQFQTSVWTERGWTFQEPLLSKRCLFFTPEYVVQVCHSQTDGEALVVSGSIKRFRSLKLTALLFESGFDWLDLSSKPRGLPSFIGEVQQYRARKFTFHCDALDAFKGILSMVDMASY